MKGNKLEGFLKERGGVWSNAQNTNLCKLIVVEMDDLSAQLL